jgi:acetyl esterase/lipase
MSFFTFAFLMFAWGHLVHYGLFSAIPISVGTNFIKFFSQLFVFSASLMITLGIVLFFATLDFEWRQNDQDAPEPPGGIYRILRKIVIRFFLLAFALILVLSGELVTVDVLMVISLFSYYLVIVYSFVIFTLLKLLPKSQIFSRFRNRLNYASFVKLSAMIVIVNFLPLTGTLISTNPSLESQFMNVFGPTWKTDIQADPTYPFMLDVPFSMYDAYFGYQIPINAKYGQVYMQSHPRYVKNRLNGEILSNGSAVFNDITQDFKFDAYLPARPEFTNITFGDGRTEKFPVLIFLHGAGSGVDRGAWNANFTTQYFANLGYAAFDISYGIFDYANYPHTGGDLLGYDFVDSVLQIATFTKYLEAHAEYFHADLSNTFVTGRSLGGWMALSVGYLANSTYAGGNFSSQIQVRGVIPFYPASDFPGFGSKFFSLLSDLFDYFDRDIVAGLQIRGSSDPNDPNFNPDWFWYNPLWVAENVEPSSLPITLGFQGTHDSNIPAGAMHRLETALKKNGNKVIAAYYPFLGHAFDVVAWSPYGQSGLYYMERMMALTSVN